MTEGTSSESPSEEPAALPPPSYRLVLPHGWVRLPLGEGAEEAVDGLVREALRGAPKGMPPDQLATLRRQLEGRLIAGLAEARDSGGVELYLPVATSHGITVPASFVIGHVPVEEAEPPAPARVVAAVVAADPTAEARQLGPHLAVRTEPSSGPSGGPPDGPSEGQDGDPPVLAGTDSRRVDYLVPTPDGRGWLTASFSTLVFTDAGEDMTDVVVELFDAVMSTFRWSTP